MEELMKKLIKAGLSNKQIRFVFYKKFNKIVTIDEIEGARGGIGLRNRFKPDVFGRESSNLSEPTNN